MQDRVYNSDSQVNLSNCLSYYQNIAFGHCRQSRSGGGARRDSKSYQLYLMTYGCQVPNFMFLNTPMTLNTRGYHGYSLRGKSDERLGISYHDSFQRTISANLTRTHIIPSNIGSTTLAMDPNCCISAP